MPGLFSQLFGGAIKRSLNRRPPLEGAPEDRTWRLAQIETAMACNIACHMCPWLGTRRTLPGSGLMERDVWEALLPHLSEIAAVDLSGGGEPLLHPELPQRVAQAKKAGCNTGLLSNATLLNEDTARALLTAGIDWIGFSLDGASAPTYEHIRRGASFDQVCSNIRNLAAMRGDGPPYIIIQAVLMQQNVHEIEDLVRLAAELGADQLTFKNCDVARGEHGRDMGIFAATPDKNTKELTSRLRKAQRLGSRLRLTVKAFALTPDELPVCPHDPRSAFFVAVDGSVCPCINLAYGGESSFFGKPVQLPTVKYGRLPQSDLATIWRESPARQQIAERFESRETKYSTVLSDISKRELDLPHLRAGLEHARRSMPRPLKGCNVCHYLYGV